MSTPFFDNMLNGLRKTIDNALNQNPEQTAKLQELMTLFKDQDWSNPSPEKLAEMQEKLKTSMPSPEKLAEMQEKLKTSMQDAQGKNQQFMEYLRNYPGNKPDNK